MYKQWLLISLHKDKWIYAENHSERCYDMLYLLLKKLLAVTG